MRYGLALLSLLSVLLIAYCLNFEHQADAQMKEPWTSVMKSDQGIIAGVSGYTVTKNIPTWSGVGDGVTGFTIDLSKGSFYFVDLSGVTHSGVTSTNRVGVSVYFTSIVTEFPMMSWMVVKQNSGNTCDFVFTNSGFKPEGGVTPTLDGANAVGVYRIWTGIEDTTSIYCESGIVH
jgi:hypothetical protein